MEEQPKKKKRRQNKVTLLRVAMEGVLAVIDRLERQNNFDLGRLPEVIAARDVLADKNTKKGIKAEREELFELLKQEMADPGSSGSSSVELIQRIDTLKAREKRLTDQKLDALKKARGEI